MRRCFLIAALAVSLALLGCAQAAKAPKVVTIRNNGDRLTMHKGAEVQLHLTERFRWGPLRIRGTAVRLKRIEYFRDPGYLAWAVDARVRGKAVITAVGYGKNAQQGCDPGPCSPHFFRVTFVVR